MIWECFVALRGLVFARGALANDAFDPLRAEHRVAGLLAATSGT